MALGTLRSKGLNGFSSNNLAPLNQQIRYAVLGTGGTATSFVGNGTIGAVGIQYDVRTWTATGTLVVVTPGWVDLLCQGGGGNSNGNTGGGAGGCKFGSFYLPTTGTWTMTVGGVGGTSTITTPGAATFTTGGGGPYGMSYGASNWVGFGGGASGSGEGGNNYGGGQGWSTGGGVPFDITGSTVVYGRNDGVGYGAGAAPNGGGVAGVIIVRVGIN